MFLLHGDARYIDVFERTAYNGFLAGVSLGGDRFFYPNPLEADGVDKFNHGTTGRQTWFTTSCCPVNVARFLPEIAGCIYATEARTIYINLFVGSEAAINLPAGKVRLEQTTGYPYLGQVELTVYPERATTFAMRVRIPGWVRSEVLPSDLYRYVDHAVTSYTVKVNGETVPSAVDKGYAVIEREWHPSDRVELALTMPVRRVRANAAVKDDAGCVALERGPLVYCVEGIDNPGDLARLQIDEAFQAVPYHLWNNRGDGPMRVWLRAGSSEIAQNLP